MRNLGRTTVLASAFAFAALPVSGDPDTSRGCGCDKPVRVEAGYRANQVGAHRHFLEIGNGGCQRVTVNGVQISDDRTTTPVSLVLQPNGEAHLPGLGSDLTFVGTATDCHGNVQELFCTTTGGTP